MAERYTRLFSLSENLYTAGAPVLIAAGALLKDNQTGKTLAQLKFKSLSEKKIKALKVTIAASDVSGNALIGVDEYQYLDLAVERNETFGQKQAIYLPDAVTRSFTAKCTEVIFEDGTAWKATEGANWNTLPEQETIADCLKELAVQYQRDTSRLSKYMLVEHEDLWLCTCGAINHNEEAACHRCNYEKAELLEAMDVEGLQARKADYDREAAEAAEKRAREAAERVEKKAAEDKVRRAKMKKIGIIAAAVVLVVVIAAVLTITVFIPNSQYNNAVALMEAGQYTEAIAAFEVLGDYKDSASYAQEAHNAIVYSNAELSLATGYYHDAYSKFKALGSYRDSTVRAEEAYAAQQAEEMAAAEAEAAALAIENARAYAEAEAFLEQGKIFEAAIAFGKLGNYEDAQIRSLELWASNVKNHTVAFGLDHIIALKTDGTVIATGSNRRGQCDVSDWRDIIAVDAYDYASIGIKSDGTVCIAGDLPYSSSKDEVSSWTNIVAICFENGIIGLKSDGTVVTTYGIEDREEIEKWTNIVAVDSGFWGNHTIGLTVDGHVVGAGYSKAGQIYVRDWASIVAITTGEDCSVGLKADGSVVTTGENRLGQLDISNWRDIIAICVDGCSTIGLKSDGTVVAAGRSSNGELSVQDWTDIVAIELGPCNSAGFKSDGTLIVIGETEDGVCEATGWTDIKLPN